MAFGKIIVGVCFSILLFLIGYFSAGLLRTGWVFVYTVEPMDIINLVVTILVSVYVAWIITKKLTEERFEKELVISDLKDIEVEIKKILDAYEKSEPGNVILPAINQLRILIDRFKKSVQKTVSKKLDTAALDSSFTLFYRFATDYGGVDNVTDVDLPSVQNHGSNLIIEVRNLISTINKK